MTRLLRLHSGAVPLEDFFTEVVAHLLARHPDLCRTWLHGVGALVRHGAWRVESVETQRNLAALEHHALASRPDVVVRLSNGRPHGEAVVFVESKVGSQEGPDQLRRYAEQLGGLDGPGVRTLLYVTRDYDPKDPRRITGGLAGADATGVRFVQARWSEFYRALARYRTSLAGQESELVSEVEHFMEEQGLARTYRLSGADLEAMGRMPRVLRVMEEAAAAAAAELQRFSGRRVRPYGTGFRTMRDWGGHSYECGLGDGEPWRCGAGYAVMPDFIRDWLGMAESDFPALRVYLNVPRQTEETKPLTSAMQEMAERRGWKANNLSNGLDNAEIMRVKSLAHILLAEDHVASIRSFFLESVADLEAFRDAYRALPWTTGR